jgi:hypothetical protein
MKIVFTSTWSLLFTENTFGSCNINFLKQKGHKIHTDFKQYSFMAKENKSVFFPSILGFHFKVRYYGYEIISSLFKFVCWI